MPFKMKSSPLHQMESDSQQRDDLMQDMPIDEDASTPLNQGTSTRKDMRKANRKERKDQRDDGINKEQRQEMRKKGLDKRIKNGSTEIKSGSDVGNFLRRAKHNFAQENKAQAGSRSSSSQSKGQDININLGKFGAGAKGSGEKDQEVGYIPPEHEDIKLGGADKSALGMMKKYFKKK